MGARYDGRWRKLFPVPKVVKLRAAEGYVSTGVKTIKVYEEDEQNWYTNRPGEEYGNGWTGCVSYNKAQWVEVP